MDSEARPTGQGLSLCVMATQPIIVRALSAPARNPLVAALDHADVRRGAHAQDELDGTECQSEHSNFQRLVHHLQVTTEAA